MGAEKTVVQAERLKILNDRPEVTGRYVLYWMQASQRAENNHALEFAAQEANRRGIPLLTVFGLTQRYPEANLRHYTFMLEGLMETRETLAKRGIKLIVSPRGPAEAALALARDASILVCDRGYLRHQRGWRVEVARRAPCQVIQVEGDAVVPVETAASQEESSAAVLRPRLRRLLPRFLVPLEKVRLRRKSLGMSLDEPDIKDLRKLLQTIEVDRSVGPSPLFPGGTRAARRFLRRFLEKNLARYEKDRGEPAGEATSLLSPYLHFGQISPLEIALAVSASRKKAREAFLEELIVRRELSLNFVQFNPAYDSFQALPPWAKSTLLTHAGDAREAIYSPEELEAARTHDPYWNAAQREMVLTGYMHNTMRMYWGKKILEWVKPPEEALRLALFLNNKYQMDGRGPNSFAGVAWCFGKHDRPWGERPVFGLVRSMTGKGLEKKHDMDAYLDKVARLGRAQVSRMKKAR